MKRCIPFLAFLSLFTLLLAACDATVVPQDDASETSMDLAGKKHYPFISGLISFNPAFMSDPVNIPSYTGDVTGPDGTVYTIVFYSTGSAKPYADPFFAGQTLHYGELTKLYTDVEFGENMVVISGDPVLTFIVKGMLAPNNHLNSHGVVLQGEGVFADWVGRKVYTRTTLGTDGNQAFFLH